MSVCTSCSSTLGYTAYIRTVRRGSKSHRAKQAYIPVGVLCLHCGGWQATLDSAIVAQIRRRRKLPNINPSPDTAD